jgi:hypothetical protein
VLPDSPLEKEMKKSLSFSQPNISTKNGRLLSLSVEKEIKDSFLFLDKLLTKMEDLLPKLSPKKLEEVNPS